MASDKYICEFLATLRLGGLAKYTPPSSPNSINAKTGIK
jgi:hypothetical protein